MTYNTYDSEKIHRDSLYDISAKKDSKGYINAVKIEIANIDDFHFVYFFCLMNIFLI